MRMPGRVAAATAVAAVMVVSPLAACGGPDNGDGEPDSQTASSPAPDGTPSPPSPTSASEGLPLGPHPVSKDIGTGVEIEVTIEAPNWQGEVKGGYMCWGECEDRGAAVIAFNDRKYFPYRDPCRWS
jgi:hypothetical protein